MTKKQARQSANRREKFQCKKTKYKRKSCRGIPEIETEKKGRVTYSLTKTAQEQIKNKGRYLDCSASSLIEDIARGRYLIIPRSTFEVIEKQLNLEGVAIVQGLVNLINSKKPD